MHIMHVIDSLAVGGAERMLVELANQTTGDGHQVSVCVTRSQTTLAKDLDGQIKTWVLNRTKRFDWIAMRRFARLVARERVDVLHSHGRSSFSFLALLKTLGAVRQPIVMHDHYGIEIDSAVPLWFKFWAKREVGHYVGVSQSLSQWAQSAGLLNNRISVIHNVLDLSRIETAASLPIRDELSIACDVPLGIVIGGVCREKGIDVLIDAVTRSKRGRAGKILIVGAARDAEYSIHCREQAAAAGLRDTILFLGERLDVANLMKSVDFALIPSISESGPLVLIEYMAAGLPFVATKVGGISQRVAELNVPEFVAAGDSEALAGALDRLLATNCSKRRQRARLGQDAVSSYFDIRRTMPRWYEVYESVLEGSAR